MLAQPLFEGKQHICWYHFQVVFVSMTAVCLSYKKGTGGWDSLFFLPHATSYITINTCALCLRQINGTQKCENIPTMSNTSNHPKSIAKVCLKNLKTGTSWV